MKKTLLFSVMILLCLVGKAQIVRWGDNLIDTTTDAYIIFSPTNTAGNRMVVMNIKGDSTFKIYSRQMWMMNLDSTKNAGQPLSMLWLTNKGLMSRTPMASITWPSSQITGLATVATTGVYNDLTGKPTIPAAQVNTDWNSVSGLSQLLNKPTLATVATTGAYADLSGKPTLATVATTGVYNDLTGKPTIPAAQVNTDWNSVSGLSQLLNKPTLATVATTGAYADLSGKPTLATVATTGVYNDLTGKPTIPAAQVNTDWNSVSGLSQLLNKPTLATVATTGAYADLTGKPTIPTGTVTSVGITSTDFAVSGSPVTTSGSITANLNTSGVAAGTYNVLTVNNKGIVTAATSSGTMAPVTRAINGTAYTISATRPSTAYYYIRIACTASIGSASSGTVSLQYSIDGGTNWIDCGELQNSNTVTLAVVLNSVTIQSGLLAYDFPANALVRMNTAITGTTTVTYIRGGERTL